MAGQVKPIPVPVILAAVAGDEDALAAVVAHYQNYIWALATRPLKIHTCMSMKICGSGLKRS